MAIVPRKKIKGTSYQVKVRGYPSKTFKTRRDAKVYEAKILLEKDKGVSPFSLSKEILLNEFWLDWSQKNLSECSEGWKRRQLQMYRDYIAPVVGSMKILAIRRCHVEAVLNRMENMNLSTQLQYHVYGLMRKVFRFLEEEEEFLLKSPVKKSLAPKVVNKPTKYLTLKEARRLLTYTKDKRFGVVVWTQMLTGLRVGEVQFLKWGHVDFENEVIHVKGTYSKNDKLMKNKTKGGNHHIVPMVRELMEYLRSIKGEVGEYVCKREDGGFFTQSAYLKSLKRYCREAGLPEISTHGNRHSASEFLYAGGAHKRDLQRFLNHKNIKTTERYSHGQEFQLLQLKEVASKIKVFG